MKIFLIHGEDTNTSRSYYLGLIDKLKKEGFVMTDISNQTNLDLGEKLVGQSLFEERVAFIHDKLKNLTANDLKWLLKKSYKYDGELIAWYEGNAPLKIIKSLPRGTNIKKFDLPRTIFKFLDAFYPGNVKDALNFLIRLLDNQPLELVFAILTRHLRDLFWVKNDSKVLPAYPSWRIGKLEHQASKFTNARLKKIINLASDADIKSKTSNGSLKEFLDLIIVTQLK